MEKWRGRKDVTLAEARTWLEKQIFGKGAPCPCCTQFAKVYRRRLNAGAVASLIRMYKHNGLRWQHIPTSLGRNDGEVAKLRYWELIEECKIKRTDGGRAGWWRVTEKGCDWVKGRITLPRYVFVYDAEPLKVEGPPTSIRDALGKKFNYDELMGNSEEDDILGL